MSKVVTILLVSTLLAGFSSAGAENTEDSTIVDGDAHQVVFENDHIRLLQVLASPGHQSAMHSHPASLVISLGTGRVRLTSPDGSQQILDFRPGTFFWVESAAHSWELLAGEVNAMAVEVKSAKTAAADQTGDKEAPSGR